ncbi:MAG: hypothetical protein RRY19_12145 [Clostridium sp.]
MMKKFKQLSLWVRIILIVIGVLFLPITIGIVPVYFATKGIIKGIKGKKYRKTILLIIPELMAIIILFLAIDLYTAIMGPADTKNQNEIVSTQKEDKKDEIKVEDNNTVDEKKEEENQLEKVDQKEEEKLPQYEIVSVDDTSIGRAVRKTINIVVKGDYTLDGLYKVAEKEINLYIDKNKINALTVGFFTDKDHIGEGYDMGRVEYVPNGVFGDAVNVESGDYSSFKLVNYLEEPIAFEKGEELKEGKSDLNKIKKDFEEVYGDTKVTVNLDGEVLYVKINEAEDNEFFEADENAISTYTDFSLDNIKSDVKYLDITVKRPSSSVRSKLQMSEMETDNGRYFDTDYIKRNIEL